MPILRAFLALSMSGDNQMAIFLEKRVFIHNR